MDGHLVSTQFFKRRRHTQVVQPNTDGTATVISSGTSDSTAGVSNMAIVECDGNVVIANGRDGSPAAAVRALARQASKYVLGSWL